MEHCLLLYGVKGHACRRCCRLVHRRVFTGLPKIHSVERAPQETVVRPREELCGGSTCPETAQLVSEPIGKGRSGEQGRQTWVGLELEDPPSRLSPQKWICRSSCSTHEKSPACTTAREVNFKHSFTWKRTWLTKDQLMPELRVERTASNTSGKICFSQAELHRGGTQEISALKVAPTKGYK